MYKKQEKKINVWDIKKLSEANVAQYHLSELVTNSNSLDAFFRSVDFSSTGRTIIFNPPEKSYIPADFPNVGLKAPYLTFHTFFWILQENRHQLSTLASIIFSYARPLFAQSPYLHAC